MNRALVAAALVCAGCGNYSTEDLEFYAALPQREDLRAEVPSNDTSGALTGTCDMGSADVWLQAKPASDEWNAGVELVVGLIDVVRRYRPTWREENERGWGPFTDENHRGIEIQVVMYRSYPDDLGGAPLYIYAFQARKKGTAEFTNVTTGEFAGASSARGTGSVLLDFEALWALGMSNAATPRGTIHIDYDRSGDPVTIDLTHVRSGLWNTQIDYTYSGWRDGSGVFKYTFENAGGDVLTVDTSYDASGAGMDRVDFVGALGATGSFNQCWDSSACLVYVDDPMNLSCEVGPTLLACSGGDPATCPVVPDPPFVIP